MLKTIYSSTMDTLLEKAGGCLFTLIESDRHVKQASTDTASEKMIRDHKPDKNHFAVHIVAMGASEPYGFNRNGDWFGRDMLLESHPTFVKHGHLFREHNNGSPKLKIGDIKAARYNKKLDRVELVVHGDKKKAEEEYEKAKSGKVLSGSMSIRVPHDECSCCGNKAKGSQFYCEHLKRAMTQYLGKFKKFAYAINPPGKFFDYSFVKNPADRIAHFLQYDLGDDTAVKAASDDNFLFSDQLADMSGASLTETGCADLRKQAMLSRLSEAEQFLDDVLSGKPVEDKVRANLVKEAVRQSFAPEHDLTDADIALLRETVDPAVLFTKLARRQSTLPFDAFASYLSGQSLSEVRQSDTFKSAKAKLQTVFRDMANSPADDRLESLFDAGIEKYACVSACSAKDPVDQVFDKVQTGQSFAMPQIKVRIVRITANCGRLPMPSLLTKDASVFYVSGEAEKLVKAYGHYKVATCVAAEQFADDTVVDSNTALFVTYQHLT